MRKLITGLEHIGIAVSNIDEALNVYEKILGLKVEDKKIIEEEEIKTTTLLAGKLKIELMEPLTEKSAVARFIDKRGEGVHHIAVTVSNLEDFLKYLKKKGLKTVTEKPKISVLGYKMTFLHPKSTRKVLLELCEKTK